MSYTLKGRLCGLVCDECEEPLARVGIRLYQAEADEKLAARAVADAKDTVAILTDAQAKQRAPGLIAETTTDDQGAFSIELDEKKYNGGPVEVDLYFETVPRPRVGKKTKPLQVAVTTLQPAWRQGESGSVGVWQYCLPNRLWCSILSRFGVWSICGHLRTCKEGQPIPGALVTAFDADWLQDDPLGSATQAGVQTYTDLYADTRRWVLEEWIDYICPQVYWAESLAVADYNVIVDWWSNVVAGRDVHLYVGQATYKIGTSTQSPEWNNLPQEMSNHLLFNSTRPEVDGNIYFSAKDVRANRLDGMGIVGRDWYRHPALVPPMPWIDASGPKAPKDLSASVGGSGTTVRWRAGDSTTVSYAVYRIPVTDQRVKPDDCVVADATNLVATMRAVSGYQTWTDTSAGGQRYTYVITGLDRTWNESVPQQVTPR